MGSKYFGRAIKKWRFFAGLSQEELAKRAQVSVALVGTIERERGHLSEEIFCKLCLGLESKLGRPMLRSVLADVHASLWQELSASESSLRQERGWEAGRHETPDTTQEDAEKILDSALVEVKKLALLWFRSLGTRYQDQEWPDFESEPREELDPAATAGKLRVRKPGRQRKSGV
jgi:transcriptional regulator with XRE-family HTH domain